MPPPTQVIVITGAGSGIGRAIALAFTDAAAPASALHLHLTDLKPERLEEVAAVVRARGAGATTHVVDSRDAGQVEALAAAVFAAHGRVDVLCNNAGVGHSALAHEMPLDTWREVIETNLLGPVYGVAAFLPKMLAQEGRGTIVNTASIAGLLGLPGMSAYCASKFGVIGMTESLSVELPPDKIHVAAICPGIINTNIVRDARISPMGAVDQAGAVAFYERFGHGPEAVARDVLAAVRERRSLVLSAAGPYAWLWRIKRLCGWLYVRIGRWMGDRTRALGFPGAGRPPAR